ncbi:MAG: YrhK family protein [Candidatus Parvarchaeota archaeon]|nr:YrhK family protein [Candidatus Parvarchaeota archaeon]MCW1294744.1 YrhK family protein [Candidatus Parvarchaeum tengchongense]MCW1295334.1 YrhK family protein [Candidatus Parvarchaeum tengchongense]MCW1299562.1 YrhK family protein [Candidatus Parvarchaeum tengchongense]MCW1311984.1 YrhK family protein [Candidatus Parvarchaeum tengchongense]
MALKKDRDRIRKEIERNYKVLGWINDFMIGLEFLVGSIEFLPGHLNTIGVYLFILGSFQILLVPTIRISRDIHLKLSLKNHK